MSHHIVMHVSDVHVVSEQEQLRRIEEEIIGGPFKVIDIQPISSPRTLKFVSLSTTRFPRGSR